MKLAEALIKRADIKNKAEQIKKRLAQNIKVQEDDEPIEDAKALFHQYNDLMDELHAVTKQINYTNAHTKLDGSTIIDAIANRDCLKVKIATYREMIEKASILRDRGFGREDSTKYVRCVDISELQKQTDEMSRQYRQLDTKIQSLNWMTDLL